jgi:hypothetical protein
MNITLVETHKLLKSIFKYSDEPLIQKILSESLDNDDNNVAGEDHTRTEDNHFTKNHQSEII